MRVVRTEMVFKAIKMNEILRGKKKGQRPSTKCSRSSRGLGTVKRAAAARSGVMEVRTGERFKGKLVNSVWCC